MRRHSARSFSIVKAPLLSCLVFFVLGIAIGGCGRVPTSQLEVVGSRRFHDQVSRALALLKERDLAAYELLTNNVGSIREAQRSGMWAYATPPTYDMTDATAFYSVTWCAATIAHDSFHSKLYHEYQAAHPGPVPDSVWIGRAAEQKCMGYQLEVMHRLRASDWEIAHARSQADGHYVTNAASWQEYKARKW